MVSYSRHYRISLRDSRTLCYPISTRLFLPISLSWFSFSFPPSFWSRIRSDAISHLLLRLFVFTYHVFVDSRRQLPASWRFRFSIEKRSTCKQEKLRRKRHSAFICQRLSLTRGEQGGEQAKPLVRESQVKQTPKNKAIQTWNEHEERLINRMK